jgi:hypothetical protein
VIVRKEDYKVDEAAYLLDLPARAILALCDAGVIACSRLVANGPKKQRTRRFVSHCEIVRFNQTRAADKRTDLASRLSDPDAEQTILPFAAEPDAPEADGHVAVWLSKAEWRLVVGTVASFSSRVPQLQTVLDKIGPAGIDVISKGLRVRNYEDLVA